MEIANNTITHRLRTLGFDKTLGSGLTAKEYRDLVGKLKFDNVPSASELTSAISSALEGFTSKDFRERRKKAARIRLIRTALRIVATELEVNVSLSRTDYPEVEKIVEKMPGKVTASALAPLLAEYIFGGD